MENFPNSDKKPLRLLADSFIPFPPTCSPENLPHSVYNASNFPTCIPLNYPNPLISLNNGFLPRYRSAAAARITRQRYKHGGAVFYKPRGAILLPHFSLRYHCFHTDLLFRRSPVGPTPPEPPQTQRDVGHIVNLRCNCRLRRGGVQRHIRNYQHQPPPHGPV